MISTVIVGLIVLACLGIAAKHIYKLFRGEMSCCGTEAPKVPEKKLAGPIDGEAPAGMTAGASLCFGGGCPLVHREVERRRPFAIQRLAHARCIDAVHIHAGLDEVLHRGLIFYPGKIFLSVFALYGIALFRST